MNRNESYVVVYRTLEQQFSDEKTIKFFDKKEEMNKLLLDLHNTYTKTNQPLSYFADVYPKGSLYPTNYEDFQKERSNKSRVRHGVMGSYFMQRINKKGYVKQKYYDFAEGFEYMLDEWEEKGYDMILLDENEAYSGDYYVQRDVINYWGEKDKALIA